MFQQLKNCQCVTLRFLQLFAQQVHDLLSPPAGGFGVVTPPEALGSRVLAEGTWHVVSG